MSRRTKIRKLMRSESERSRDDVQPWLEYFDMLQRHIESGYLDVNLKSHAAYITHTALHAISGTENMVQLMEEYRKRKAKRELGNLAASMWFELRTTAKRIHTYYEYLATTLSVRVSKAPFPVYVVADDYPHDLLYTILVTRRRLWWCPWRKKDVCEIITYK